MQSAFLSFVVVAATGCFTKPGAPGAGGGGDGGPDAPYATTFGPFGPAQPVPGIQDSPDDGNFDAAISKYADEIYFSSERNGGVRMWRATMTPTGEFTQVERFDPGVGAAEWEATLSESGLQLYFYDGSHNISKRTRTSPTAAWMPAAVDTPAGLGPFDFCCDDQRIIGGSVQNWQDAAASKLIEYVKAGASWTAGPDLMIGPGSFGVIDPSISRDGLEVFYEVQTATDGEIWRATRTSLTTGFSSAEKLEIMGLQTGSFTGDPELTVDGTRLYFSYLTATGDYQQYFVERQPLD